MSSLIGSDGFIPFSAGATDQAASTGNEGNVCAPALLTSVRAPWLQFDPSINKLSPFVRFHNEILTFCDFSSPSRLELNNRKDAYNDIRNCILELFPTATVEVFGSHMTGIITPSSDIDIAMLNIAGEDEVEPLYRLANLINEKKLASYCEVIANAKVPIVKLDHKATGIPMDICCNNTSGLETGALMRKFARYSYSNNVGFHIHVVLMQVLLGDETVDDGAQGVPRAETHE